MILEVYDRVLPTVQKCIRRKVYEKEVLTYKKDDKLAAVRDIVEFGAIKPPTAVVSRLLSSTRHLLNCNSPRE